MIDEEKLKKVCEIFSSLPEEQQDYILGILQAMVFVNNTYNQAEAGNQDSKADNDTDGS